MIMNEIDVLIRNINLNFSIKYIFNHIIVKLFIHNLNIININTNNNEYLYYILYYFICFNKIYYYRLIKYIFKKIGNSNNNNVNNNSLIYWLVGLICYTKIENYSEVFEIIHFINSVSSS